MAIRVYKKKVKTQIQVHVPLDQSEKDLVACAQVLDSGRAGSNMATEQIIEDLGNVLLGLELKLGNVVDQELQEVVAVDFLSKLSNGFWDWVVFYKS